MQEPSPPTCSPIVCTFLIRITDFFCPRMSSIVRSVLILLRTHSLLNRSSSRRCFCFTTSRRLRSSWSFFCWALCWWSTLCLWRCCSSESLFSMCPHLAISFLREDNCLDKADSEAHLRKSNFCRRFFGRCWFLSSIAICRRSQHSKEAVGFLSCKWRGRCLCLSCRAMCCCSHRFKFAMRNGAWASYRQQIFCRIAVLSTPATSHARATADWNRSQASSKWTGLNCQYTLWFPRFLAYWRNGSKTLPAHLSKDFQAANGWRP